MSPAESGNGRIFLSYARSDEERARGVAAALEAHRCPVWWDRDIGPGRRFDEAIAEALRSAPAVVVLWSRASVASEWVREEASEAKRRNVLVPVILDPVELPLGFTLRQAVQLTTWNGSPDAPELAALVRAINAVAARSTAELPQSVSSQDAPRARRDGEHTHPPRRRISTAALSALAVLVLGLASGLWYLDAFYFEHVDYVANVTKRWGFPQGVSRLSTENLKRRNVSIALIRHGRRNPVDELRVVNATGNTPPASTYMPPLSITNLSPLPSASNPDNPNSALAITRLTFSRDSNGRILEQKAYSRGGRLIYTLHFSAPELAEFKRHGFGVPARESGINYVRFVRAATGPHAGLDQEIHYVDDKQQPRPDENGEYGNRMIFNEQGQIAERIVLGPDHKDRPNAYGLLREVLTYDESGNLLEGSTFDGNGAPTASRLGPARHRLQYDESGNLTHLSFYDTAGQLMAIPALGAAGRTFTYDEHGNLTSGSFVGPDRAPVIGRLGFAKQTIEWLAPNRALARFFGPSGRPTPVFGGAFEGLETFDSRGLSIETTYRDEHGNPTRSENGCSTIRMAYDEVGNVADWLCLDESKARTLSTYGYSRARFTYDDVGNPLTTHFLDADDRPRLQSELLTSYRHEYNEFGKPTRLVHLNERGQPQRSRTGYAAVAYTYDSKGNQTGEAYLDERDRPVANVFGYAAIRSTFDDRRRLIETVYLGSGGRPVRSDQGYAIARFAYDARGHVERAILLDETRQATKGADGFASYRVKWNDEGQRIEIMYYDERGAVTLTRRPGSAIRRWTYNRGRVVERADFDTTGRPVVNAYGYSIMTFGYDEFGRETGRGLLDASRRPVTMKVAVETVRPGSVAADAQLQAGDLILTYAGTAVETTHQFSTKLELFKGDRPRDLTIARGDRVLTLTIPPGRLDGAELREVAR